MDCTWPSFVKSAQAPLIINLKVISPGLVALLDSTWFNARSVVIQYDPSQLPCL